MGKILIIKDSDFSKNAIEKLLTEPSLYYTVGFGSSRDFSNGEYWINPNYSDSVFFKDEEGSMLQLEESCFVRYKDKPYYMYLDSNANKIKFMPYYGLENVEAEVVEGSAASVVDGKVQLENNGGFDVYKIVLKAGESVTWATYGASDANAISEINNSASIISKGPNYGNIVYTADTDNVTLYFNHMKTFVNKWIAKVTI